jgi:hypothetical protein
MGRATKLVVIAWIAMALAAEVWTLRGAWPALPTLAFVGFLAAVTAGTLDARAVSVVLAPAYLFPALVFLQLGRYHAQFAVLWMVVVFGVILPRSLRTDWHTPPHWTTPLCAWAAVIVLGASLVAAREVDFTPALIGVTTVANTAGGGWPAFVIGWVLHVAVVMLLGMVWFDWLLSTDDREFHWYVVAPLALSCIALAAVAAYQLFVDLSFLNATLFGNMARATGTMLDANVCGAIAMLWTAGFLLHAQRFDGSRFWIVLSGAGAAWIAVWASGSRTAFIGSLVIAAFSAVGLFRGGRLGAIRVVGAAVAVIAIAAAVVNLADVSAVGPVRRLLMMFPSFSPEDIRGVLWEELWNRNRYGIVSTAMIREYPWFGVGLGSFQSFLHEFSAAAGGPLTPDNAQNWYRHQVAELGVVGSIPWMAWLIVFGRYLLRPRVEPRTWIARGAVVAFAIISWVGMPGQDAFVAMTFSTMAAWLVKIEGPPAAGTRSNPAAGLVLGALVMVFMAGTLHAGLNDLRVPVRAQRVGWPYSYGLYPPVSVDGREDRWTKRRAVAVIEAPTRLMIVSARIDHRLIGPGPFTDTLPRALTRPTRVRIWRDGELVVDREITDTAPVVERVPIAGDSPSTSLGAGRWVMLETWVSREVELTDLGLEASRELGMLLNWTFVALPDQPGSR